VKPITVGWRHIETFSGHGNSLTESFNIESGQFRIKWETSHETAAGKGAFLVMVHSAVSGHILRAYNPIQRATYLAVVFLMFPLIVWTGLAMSPAFVGAVPFAVTVIGGRQTARTLHFFLSVSLVLFVIGHVTMVWRAGFVTRVTAMITGRPIGEPRRKE
jgi:thiosulfate reductase cytochrome b subunit